MTADKAEVRKEAQLRMRTGAQIVRTYPKALRVEVERHVLLRGINSLASTGKERASEGGSLAPELCYGPGAVNFFSLFSAQTSYKR